MLLGQDVWYTDLFSEPHASPADVATDVQRISVFVQKSARRDNRAAQGGKRTHARAIQGMFFFYFPIHISESDLTLHIK